MKKVIERIRTAPLLAVLIALCAASSAWADVTPAAVWESDFGVQKTRGAYTLTLPADSWVDSDGNLNIASGDTSAKISFTGGGSAISVLMEYENAVASSATAGMIPIIVNPSNTANQFGVKVFQSGSLGLSGSYQTGTVYPKSGTSVMTTMPSSGVLLFSMPNGGACSVYSATTREGLTETGAGCSITGLLFTNSTLTQIGLGGPVDKLNNISNFTGLKIKKVAIFKSAISASDAAAYVFPSERSFDYSATVTSANTTWTDISWDNGATWDDAADNTSKSVYLKFSDGASVVRDGGLAAGGVYLHGEGSLNFTDSAGTEATVSSAIGGIGSVIAQSGTIKFTGANTFLGGLTVKSGAIATTTSTSGFGAKDCTVTVENGGAADIAKTGASTYKFVIEGTGVNNSGALYSTEAIGGGSKQAQSIVLTGDATITVGANWGIINDGYAAASLSLGTHTLTKKGVGRFWICNTTISGTGTIKVESGFLDTISNSYTSNGASAKIKICSGATMFIGGDTALDGLDYTFGNLSIGNLEIEAGGNVTVASGRTLTVTSSLVSNGTITDNGTITCSGTISGADQSITIGSGATFTWQNQAWSSGDYFTGDGTLELSVSSGLKEMSATSNFSGILKLTGSKNDNNYPVIGESSGDAENIFVGMPELVLNGYMGLQNSFVGKSLSVRDFSDTSASDRIRMNKFTSSSSIKTIKTKQTKDTTVQGRFQYASTGPTYSALTVYGDDSATEIHSLTLSGANETLGPLTVQNNAKVILATGGKWAGPTTVENGGFLEAKHTSAPLAALTLNAGATIVIPSSTTTTGTGDEAVTTTTTTPITASGAITFSGSGVVNVDLSNAAISEGNAATVIMTGASIANITSENVDEIFQETSGEYKFTIDGNSVKAQNIGTCTWTGSAWDGDPADYNEVVVNVDAGGTTLTLDRAYSFRRVTLSGSAGTLTISGAGSITTDELIIPSGVTMTATSLISTLVISGDGTLNIPLGTTYTMNGVTCSAQVTCAGKLITQGTTVLSNSTSTYSGEVVVESGITDFNSAQKGVTGKITIDSGATFRTDFDQWDHLDYNGTCEVHVYGTINFKNVWSVGSNNTFYFYNGCTISGQGNTHISSIDWVGAKVYVKADKNGGKGTVTFPVTSRLRANTTIEVDEGMTFTMNGPLNSSTGTGFGFTKQGGGVFNFTPSSTASFTGTTTVAAGQMIMTSDPTFGTIQIDESAVFTLRSDLNGSTTYTGTGTLELENLSGNKWYLQNTAFAGKIKTKNSGSNYWIGGANANGGQAPLFSGYPELIAESGQQLLNRNFNGKTLPVRDLSGNATFYVGNVDTDADRATRTVSTKQTKNTTFGGLFKSYNDCTTSLSVYGEDSANVYALTLTGASTSAGGLTVSTYAKVVFSGAGSWHNGLVTVGANGYLESTNAAAVTKLTLQDGANIVFPAATSSLGGISELAFATGTTYISFPDGVTPTDGAMLIDWGAANLEAAPAGEFALADSTLAGEWILTKSADGLSIAAAGAQIVYSNGDVVPCAAVDGSTIAAFMTAIGTDEGATLRILDNTSIDTETITALASQGLYYDSATKTISKAVAKVNTAVYPSLASAVAAAADGDSVYLQRASTETITINAKAITLVQTAAFSGTLSGNGTITLQTLSTSLHFDSWTGTVVLPALTANEECNFNAYGVFGSTVRLAGGFSTGWLANAAVNPAIEIPSGQTLTLGSFSPSYANAFAALKGDGTFAITATADQDNDLANVATWGAGLDHYSAYFRIGDVSGFHGSIVTSSDVGVALGSTKPAKNTTGGKIFVYGDVTVGEGATWTAPNGVVLMEDAATLTVPSGATVPKVATSVDNSYAKADAGESSTVYSVDGYNTVAFAGTNMTATRTDALESAIKDGDTITFTIAPESGYAVAGVTASSGAVTESNGVYSYTVTQDATITVATVSAVTFSEVEFDYYVGYGSAKSVSATVTGTPGENTAWTLTVGETEYAGGVYDSATGKVTWTPENGIANLAAGQALSYSIAATGGSMGTLADQQTTVGNVVDGWIAEDATHNATGTWSPSAPAFGDADSAALSGETTFTANSQASGKVTLTTVVKFGNEADSTIEIGADAKAAIKVENNSFKIWTKTTAEGGTGATADWLTVSGATPKLEADSMVVFTFDTDAKTFTVSVGGNALYYGASNTNTSFAFASDGVAISSVAYKGAGSFTSLTGEYTTTDIAQTVDGKGVVVANSFISGNAALREMTIEEAALALAPNSSATCGNGLNYFANYALGLDPTKADDKPIVDVTTDTEGKFVFTVKHRNAAGELVEITPADNVSTAVTLKYGTGAASLNGSATGAAISPAAMFSQEGLNGSNVIYYKAEVSIGAK